MLACLLTLLAPSCSTLQDGVRVERFVDNPILTVESVGDASAYNFDRESQDPPFVSLAGPSLVRVPDWVTDPLGRYYLYFAHHKGGHLRMAYADRLAGPWKVYREGRGVLRLSDVRDTVRDHVASPDVHVDHEHQRFVMYFHGPRRDQDFDQRTWVATSADGLAFERHTPEILGEAYFRVFRWGGYDYALSRLGPVYRSRDGLHDFELGPTLFTPAHRHFAAVVWNNRLYVFFSKKNDDPERIKLVTIELNPDWSTWKVSDEIEVLWPSEGYETSHGRRLLDPHVYEEDGSFYLLYSASKERAIAIAHLFVSGWTGLNISAVRARSSQAYRRAQVPLALGERLFLDSDVPLLSAPSELIGRPFLLTALEDQRSNPFARFLSFQVNQEVRVLVAHDDRFGARPEWLAQWKPTGQWIEVGDAADPIRASLFERNVTAGRVVLGGNCPDGAELGEDRLMYTVILAR